MSWGERGAAWGHSDQVMGILGLMLGGLSLITGLVGHDSHVAALTCCCSMSMSLQGLR